MINYFSIWREEYGTYFIFFYSECWNVGSEQEGIFLP